MSPNLTGYVCLVTGATKGIGRGIALQLASSGAKVYYTGRTEQLLNEIAEEMKARGGEPHPVRVCIIYCMAPLHPILLASVIG